MERPTIPFLREVLKEKEKKNKKEHLKNKPYYKIKNEDVQEAKEEKKEPLEFNLDLYLKKINEGLLKKSEKKVIQEAKVEVYAGIIRRVIASFTDIIILFLLSLFIYFLIFLYFIDTEKITYHYFINYILSNPVIIFILFLFISTCYFTFTHSILGQSIGKYIFKIKVVSLKGEKINFIVSLLRWLILIILGLSPIIISTILLKFFFKFWEISYILNSLLDTYYGILLITISISIFNLGYLWIFVDYNRRGLHDKFTFTIVIKKSSLPSLNEV